MAQGYVKAADLPQVIPVFPLPGAILLPRGQLPLNVFEPRYLQMLEDVMSTARVLCIVQPEASEEESPAGKTANVQVSEGLAPRKGRAYRELFQLIKQAQIEAAGGEQEQDEPGDE